MGSSSRDLSHTAGAKTTTLSSAIEQVVQEEADRLRDAAIASAVAAFEADLREAIGVKAIRVADYYHVDRDARGLTITVKTGGGQ